MLVFDTIAELTATAPTSGESAFVAGYNAPGDGGGGLFRFSNGGEATDGALAFPFDGDVSAEQSDTIALTALNGFALGSNVAWGSVGLDLDTTIPITLTDVHLHGHAFDDNATNPLSVGFGRLNYATGIFTDRGDTIRVRAGAQGGVNVTVRRKVITSNRRWVRVPEQNAAFQLAWIGPQGGTDSGHLLAWSMLVAVRNGYSTVDLNKLTSIISGIVEIPMNMTVQNGHIMTRGGNWPMLQQRLTPAYDFSDPEYFVDQMAPLLTGANSSDDSGVEVTLRSVDLDGNIANNQAPITDAVNYDDAQVQNLLQNSTEWSGLSWTNQQGRIIPLNSFARLYDCHIHDFGSNCLTLNFEITIFTDNLTIGNSARNHLWYGTDGVHNNLYMYGFAWGTYSKSSMINVTGAIIEQLVDNPYYDTADTIWHYEGDDWGDGSLNPVNRFNHRPQALWQGVTVNMGEAGIGGPLFGALGQAICFENLTIITGTTNGCRVFKEVSNAGNGLNRNIQLKNVTMIVQNGPGNSNILSEELYADHLSIENFTMFVRRGFAPPDKVTAPAGPFLELEVIDPAAVPIRDPGFAFSRLAELRNFSYIAEYGLGPIRLSDVKSTALDPVVFVIENGTLRIAQIFVVTVGNSGRTDLWTIDDPTRFEGIWKNVRIDAETFNAENLRAFFFTAKSFESVTTQWASVVTQKLLSEQIIAVSQSFVGQTQIDISTDLLWVPKFAGNVFLTPKNQLAAQELNGVSISFRDRGNTTDAEWDDLISGMPDYRAPIVRLTVPSAIAAGTLEFEISLRVV